MAAKMNSTVAAANVFFRVDSSTFTPWLRTGMVPVELNTGNSDLSRAASHLQLLSNPLRDSSWVSSAVGNLQR